MLECAQSYLWYEDQATLAYVNLPHWFIHWSGLGHSSPFLLRGQHCLGRACWLSSLCFPALADPSSHSNWDPLTTFLSSPQLQEPVQVLLCRSYLPLPYCLYRRTQAVLWEVFTLAREPWQQRRMWGRVSTGLVGGRSAGEIWYFSFSSFRLMSVY